MADYISKQAAIDACYDGCADCREDCADNIRNLPPADVKPVVRGRWIEWWPGDCALIMTGEEMLWMCSECTAKFSDKSSFCPNCGSYNGGYSYDHP